MDYNGICMDNRVNTSGSISPYQVYTVDEAADILQVNKKTIYQLQKQGKLPIKRLGRGFKFLGEHLLKVMGSAVYSDKKDTV